ncbi:Carbonic anhydrase- protein 10 [Branchiostoma belcheri]|nr:Carbonic anhydrase- protein 10 [Branchiostoma belcheri]
MAAAGVELSREDKWRKEEAKEVISSLLLWKPYGKTHSRKLTYPATLTRDTGLQQQDLPAAMEDRTVWRRVVQELAPSPSQGSVNQRSAIDSVQIGGDKARPALHSNMNGTLINTGHDLTFQVDDRNRVNLTGGPLSYLYRLQELRLHYGSIDSQGSEHSVDGYSFPGELQLLFYNYDLYGDLAEATKGTSGLAIISLFIQIGNTTNPELDKLLWNDRLQNVTYKGAAARVEDFNLTNLFPTTPHYMTYQGSLTSPDCAETVTWIVMNKPVYISRKKTSLQEEWRKRSTLELTDQYPEQRRGATQVIWHV